MTPEEIHANRCLAVRLCEWATNGSKGSAAGNPRYDVVTENRRGAMYSSCGDLPHWMLYRLGVRLYWVNRDENKTRRDGWRMGWNITYLADKKANPLVHEVTADDQFQGGDVIVICGAPGTEHALVVIDHLPTENKLLTAEFGQPGGALRTRTLTQRGAKLQIGSRIAIARLGLAEVLQAAEAAEMLTDWDVPEVCRVG